MPVAGLYLGALARPHDDLVLRGHVELPHVGHGTQPGLAGARIHRQRPDGEIAHIERDAAPLLYAGPAIHGGAVEQHLDGLDAAERGPYARVTGDAAAT